MLNYPSVRHMRAFTAIARLGSFGQAAEELYISQSALSQSLSQLEDILEVKLIDRTTRSMQLTTVGEQLYPRVARWLEEMEETFVDVQENGRLSHGHVRVTCLASIAIRILPPVIEKFSDAHPGIKVSIRDDTGYGVEHRVIERTADFGLAGGPVREPSVEFTPLFKEPYKVLCPTRHPLAKMRSVSWADLASHDYIALGEETNIGRQLSNTFDERRITPHVVQEVSQLGTVWGLVGKGLGISVLPASACPDHGQTKTIPLKTPKITREVGLLTLKGCSLTPAAAQFRLLLEQMVPSLIS